MRWWQHVQDRFKEGGFIPALGKEDVELPAARSSG